MPITRVIGKIEIEKNFLKYLDRNWNI
jgi:hypothetical protein